MTTMNRGYKSRRSSGVLLAQALAATLGSSVQAPNAAGPHVPKKDMRPVIPRRLTKAEKKRLKKARTAARVEKVLVIDEVNIDLKGDEYGSEQGE